MERKMTYMAPAVFDLRLEAEGSVLYLSVTLVEDSNFESVDTMGQQVHDEESLTFNHVWK